MTWTYSLALATAKDQIRLLVGDTDTTDQQVQDEEIAYFVTNEANTYMAASRIAATIAAKYTRKADKAVGDLKISYKGIAAQYLTMVVELRSRGMTHQVPTAGGIKVSDTASYENNSGIRHGSVKRGMTDYIAPSTIPNTEGN